MQKIIFIFSFFLFLGACSSQKNQSFTFYSEHGLFTINFEEHTISHLNQSYSFEIIGDKTTIFFPDGSTFWQEKTISGYSGELTSNQGLDYSSSGEELMEALSSIQTHRHSNGSIFPALFVFVISLLQICFPKVSWHLSYGWKFKNAEPSDSALMMTSISGVIGIIFAFFLLYTR